MLHKFARVLETVLHLIHVFVQLGIQILIVVIGIVGIFIKTQALLALEMEHVTLITIACVQLGSLETIVNFGNVVVL